MRPGVLGILVAGLAFTCALCCAACRREAAPANDARQDAGNSPVSARSALPAGALAAARWPLWRGDAQNTGHTRETLGDDLELLWQFQTGADLGPPAKSDPTVQRSEAARCIRSSPVIADGLAFVGAMDEHVYAVRLADGAKAWSFHANATVEAPPAVVEDAVVIGCNDGTLYCLDRKSGRQRWQYKTEGSIKASVTPFRAPVATSSPSSPAAGKLKLLVTSYDMRLHCVDFETGRREWVSEKDYWINGSAAVAGDLALYGSCDTYMHAVSLGDGRKVRRQTLKSYCAATVAVRDGRAYVGTMSDDPAGGDFFCLDVAAAGQVWRYPVPARPQPTVYASAAVGPDRVIFADQNGLVTCLSPAGKRLWQYKTPSGGIDSSPVLAGDKVVFGADNGRLYILSAANGTKLWAYDIGSPIKSSPAVAGGLVSVGCDDGNLYLFGPKE